MSDTERIGVLEAEVAELKKQVDRDDEDRRELLNATAGVVPALQSQQQQWQQMVMAVIENLRQSPEVGNARADALLPHFNTMFQRLQAVESLVMELSTVVVQTFEIVRARDGGKGE